MADKLRIISLGGLGEIGKNLYVYECGSDLIVVDCGMGFPDDELLGVDLVIPDISYLVNNKSKIRGIVITHGHEDHIGALPYVLKEINVPVFCTNLTAGLIEIKLEEEGNLFKADIRRVKAGDTIKLGCFGIEFINVNHSIADAVALAITTPQGIVLHTGDFKVDTTPIVGEMIDLARLGQLGEKGILALLSDSTNVERPGFSMSEQKVGATLDGLFKDCKNRIVVTTFASNIHRLQQIIDCAVRYDRKVAITGRSMENILRVAIMLNYMDIPPHTIVELSQVKNLPKEQVCIITTGSQGEPMSGLYRMAFSAHRQVDIGPGDRVIISASPIPGNEKSISKVINELFRKGADVIYKALADIHTSGHAYQEELKMMLSLTKPQYFIPVHGEYRHLVQHAKLAVSMGVDPKNTFISEIGKVIEISENGAEFNGVVPSGRILVDGLGVGDVGSVVIRDRRLLSEDGLIVVAMVYDEASGEIVSGPDITTRGFVYMKESENLMEELRELAFTTAKKSLRKDANDMMALRIALRGGLSDFLTRKVRRNPMILPIIMTV